MRQMFFRPLHCLWARLLWLCGLGLWLPLPAGAQAQPNVFIKPQNGWLPVHVGINTGPVADSLVVRLYVPPDPYLPYYAPDSGETITRLMCYWTLFDASGGKVSDVPLWSHKGAYDLDFDMLGQSGTASTLFAYERCRLVMPRIAGKPTILQLQVADDWGHQGGLVMPLPVWPEGLAGWPDSSPILLPQLPVYAVGEPLSFTVPVEIQALSGDTLPAPSLSTIALNPKLFDMTFKPSDKVTLTVDEAFTPLLARPYRVRFQFGAGPATLVLPFSSPDVLVPQSVSMALQPLVYLDSKSKLKKAIKLAQDQPVASAVQAFWQSYCAKPEAAAALARLYALRVQFANRNFTTYKLGWKTDMGKVYLLFGPPQAVSITATEQVWYYERTPAPIGTSLYADPQPVQFRFWRFGGGDEPIRWVLERLGEYDPFVQACLTAWRTSTVLKYLGPDEKRSFPDAH